MGDINKLLFAEKTHSSSSKIPPKINKKRIFWIINLIKTIVVEIASNKSSFKKLFPEADPLIAVQKIIPKSINKLTGTLNIKKANKKNAPTAQINILFCIRIKEIDIKINKLIVKINNTPKKK